jgi:hypothetical protein
VGLNLGKKKSFTFQEEDVEWINSLITEWVDENEGKNQSDMILELLKDYKSGNQEKNIEAFKKHRGYKDHFQQLSAANKGKLEGAKNKLSSIRIRINEGTKRLTENIKSVKKK